MNDTRGQREALFEALYHRYYQKLLRQANAYFGYKKQHLHLAENAVQDTFSLAFEAGDSFLAHPAQEAWLRLVLRRRLYWYRQIMLKDQKHTFAFGDGLPAQLEQTDEPDAIEQLLQDAENRDIVARLLRPLNDRERALIRQFYFERKTSAEIAAFYGTSDRVVNTQLYRIRKKIKKILKNGIFLLIWALCFHI